MEKKWKNPQSFIIALLIAVIFAYMLIDTFISKPQLKKDITEVKMQYSQLSSFLEQKIPEIDSTFVLQAQQIKEQKEQMDTLEMSLSAKIK